MALNANRIRLMKEKANFDVDNQCNVKYNKESKSTKNYKIPINLINDYIKSPDKTLFLLEYAKCEVVG